MERDKVKVIQIQANDIIQKEYYIKGLKDSLKLYIQKSFGCKIQEDCNPQDYYIFSCSQELDNGIYTFEIEEQIPLYSQVFVGLKQAVQAKTYLSNEEYLIKEYKEGFCVIGGTNICQINPLENMIQTNKPIPYEFQAITNLPIGILKAYKINYSLKNIGESYLNYLNNSNNLNHLNNFNDTNTISIPNIYNHTNHTNTISNTNPNSNSNLDLNINSSLNENTNPCLKDSTNLNNSHNEIYTIDTEQTIQLRAFVYEEQRTYVKEVEDEKTQIKYEDTLQQGNITKNIITLEYPQIQWAFKIVNGTYLAEESKENHQNTKKEANKGNTRKEPFPLLSDKQTFSIAKENKLDSIPQGYVELENRTGDCITLSLKDLFTDKVLESLVGKNIIFFAYDKDAKIKIPTSGNGAQEYAGKKVNINNAYAQYAMQDYQEWSKRKITHDRVTSIELKILQTRFSLEFDGETLMLLENQRILKEWNVSSEKAIENLQENDTQGNHTITTTYNPHLLDLKGINLLGEQKEKLKEDICKTLQDYNIPENLLIPLKVEYQKRILIVIERFKETSEATMGRIYIGIDGKIAKIKIKYEQITLKDKEKRKEKIYKEIYEAIEMQMTDLSIHTKNLPNDKAFGAILDRPGPDSIGGELKLRIPSGRYEVEWKNSETFGKVLNLKNEFVGVSRNILIHSGNSPKNSEGCMLLSRSFIKKGEQYLELIDGNSQKAIRALAVLLETKIPEYLGVKARGESFINNFVGIYVVNSFKE